jgi:ribosomal protein S18 acetylase RimI-like enzyme
MRIRPWVGAPRTAQLVALPGREPPDADALDACCAALATRGYRAALTVALPPRDAARFAAAGFEIRAQLHVLDRLLTDLPARPPYPGETRRLRRTDWSTIAAVDARAFPGFWHLDRAGIDEACRATPAALVQVATLDDAVIGYGVFGRAGAHGYVQRLAVDPVVARRGIGTNLVLDGLEWLRDQGATRATINTQTDNHGALRLYRRLGFDLRDEPFAVLGRTLSAPPR